MAAPYSLLCSDVPDAKAGLKDKQEMSTGRGWVVLLVWQLLDGLGKGSQLGCACFLRS